MVGIRPKEAFLNRGYGKPELGQLVRFIVSLQGILEFADFEVQFPG